MTGKLFETPPLMAFWFSMGESGKSLQNESLYLMLMISDLTEVALGKPVVTRT